MSRTAVIVSNAEDSRALCRLCMIYHEYFVDIFIPNNTFRICAEEAIHDLLSIKVAVGDGLPSNICHQCVKKLMEFRDFKDMCLKTAAELRKCDLDNFLKILCYLACDDAVDRFYDILQHALSIFTHLHRHRKSNYPKWFSPALELLITEKKVDHETYKNN